jgi:cyclopropane-fatty-acyl-phospholipid synthase
MNTSSETYDAISDSAGGDVVSALAMPPRREATELILRMAQGLRGGTVVLSLPDGQGVELGQGEPRLHCMVHDENVFERVLKHGDIGFAEAYLAGEWESDHLAELLTLLASNREVLTRAVYGSFWRLLGHRLLHFLRSNTRSGSRRNIEAHYDLGNSFYTEWLDNSMTYSSALFAHPAQTLEEAQSNKYRSLLRDMGVQPGQHILEIGCGWGGLAEVACTEFGCRVTGLTLSPSQLAWAQVRAESKGFAEHAEFLLQDYRDERGTYDHIVSIEMIEAVGERFWPTYFRQLASCLKPGGRIGIQAITIHDSLFARYRRGTDFIQRYVFPGGMLPSPRQIALQAQQVDLEITGARDFGLDYARTLVLWREAFEHKLERVKTLGFDESFIRLWRFYLSYCEAGFRAGSTNVHHYVLTHAAPR